jgi:glycosyltransferase involved in cell wall biosynthesis
VPEKILFIAANARSLIANRGDLIREMKEQGHHVHALIPEYDFLPQVKSLDITYDLIQLSRTGVDPWSDRKSYRQLKKLIAHHQPDIVYSYSIKPVIYGSLAAQACNVPMVAAMITGMGYLFTGETLRQRLLRSVASRMYRRGLAAADRIFFQNPDDLELFRNMSLLNGRNGDRIVRTNGSGINLERFPQSPPPVPPENRLNFLMIARLLQDKGVREFVQAAHKVAALHSDVRFTVVGPHDPHLPHALPADEVEQWRRRGIVNFTGGVTDVRPYLRDCSVYVLPSYREGTPRSVLEAMATGRPVITTDTPGCRETVMDGENGFLVPVKSVDALAGHMEQFIRNPCLITEMGVKSRQFACDKYDVRKVNRVILDAIGLKPNLSEVHHG